MSGSALAAKKRLAIMASEGGASDPPVRAQITKALKKNKVQVKPKPKVASPSDDEGWVALGRKLKVDGFVVLSFEAAARGKRSVEVSIRNAGDGTVAGSETFTAKGPPKKLAAAVGKGFWSKLKVNIEQVGAKAGEGTGMPARDLAHEEQASKPAADEPATSATESAPEPAKEEATKDAAKPAPPEASGEEKTGEDAAASPTPAAPVARKAAPEKKGESAEDQALAGKMPALIVVVAPHMLSRGFYYTPTSAAPVTAMLMPTIAGDATWFPIANLGVNIGGEFASWLKYLNKYPTITTDLHASLVFRLQLSSLQLWAHAGGFRHFTASQDDGLRMRGNQAMPDVVYTGARFGGGARYWVSNAFSVSVAGSYRLVTSLVGGTYGITTGPYFPRAVAGPGLDGTGFVALRVSRSFELQAGGDVRRYVITTGPSPRITATYATDQYFSGWVGLAGTFGGL